MEIEFKTSAVAQARNLMDDVQKYLANETSQSVLFEKIDKTCDDYIKSLNKLIKKIKTYKGIRHKLKYPCRGQRTHTNAKTVKKLLI